MIICAFFSLGKEAATEREGLWRWGYPPLKNFGSVLIGAANFQGIVLEPGRVGG